MHFELRDATRNDVDGIRRVARQSWTEAYTEILGADGIEQGFKRWYDEGSLRETISNDLALVAVKENTIVGYAIGTTTERTGTVDALYVQPKFWGENIGSAVLAKLLERFTRNGFSLCKADVFSENQPAIEFFRSQGFTASSCQEVPVTDTDTAEITQFEKQV